MKKMKCILIIAAVIIAIGFVFLAGKRGKESTGGVLDGDGMVNPYGVSLFSYDRGGGMENARYLVTLEAGELTVEKRTGEKTTVKKYEVPGDTVSEIEKILYDSGMKKRQVDFPESEYVALDADTVSVVIDYYDGAHIAFDSNHEVPKECWDAVNETMRLLEAIADR